MIEKTVLVIDDQAHWRNLLCEILEDEFGVQSAASLENAREILLKQKPPFHVIVSDIRLVDSDPSNEDGLRLIKELVRGNQTNVIVITGYPTLETARKALKDLAVYDYLQKVPSNGQPFDVQAFLDLVRQAAEDAEQQRSGIIYIPHRAAILEPHPAWRERISRLLRSDGYTVQELEQEVPSLLKEPVEYDLLVINESLLDERLHRFLQGHPAIKIIILTDKNADFVRKVSSLYTLDVISLQNSLDEKDFRIKVYQAFSTQLTKYITLHIEDEPDVFEQGKTYRLHVEIGENPSPDSTPFIIEPQAIRGNRLFVKVLIYAPGIKFSNTETVWKTSLAPQPSEHLSFEFTPQEAGQKTITLELEANGNAQTRIEKNIYTK